MWCGCSWCGKGGGFVCGAGVLWFQSVVHSVVSCVLRHSLSERLVSIYLHLVVNFTFGEYSDGMICFCFGASEVVLRCFVVCVVCFCGLFTFSCAEHKIVVCVFPRRARWTSQMHVFLSFRRAQAHACSRSVCSHQRSWIKKMLVFCPFVWPNMKSKVDEVALSSFVQACQHSQQLCQALLMNPSS